MTIVWDKPAVGEQLGAVSEQFIAIWGEPDNTFHVTFVVHPEWRSLAEAIEKIVTEYSPIRPIWEWPIVEPKDEL